MENYLWQKTLLDLYKSYDGVAIIMDSKLDKLIANSFNSSCDNIYDEMFLAMKRKNNCKMAKAIVDDVLELMIKENRNILKYYYKDKLSYKQIAQLENVDVRQVFRNFDKELKYFAYLLVKNGYDSEKIAFEFEEDALFANKHKQLERKTNKRHNVTFRVPFDYVDDGNKEKIQTTYQSDNNIGFFVNLD